MPVIYRGPCCTTFFCIMGNFEPDEVTAILGLQPDEVRRIGDRKGTGQVAELASWVGMRQFAYNPDGQQMMRTTMEPFMKRVPLLRQLREEFDAFFVLEIQPQFKPWDDYSVLVPPADIMDFCYAHDIGLDFATNPPANYDF